MKSIANSTYWLNKAQELPSFKHVPPGYWFLGVRSKEDKYNQFDDKIALFRGLQPLIETSCTTNSGDYGIFNYAKYGVAGVAQVKGDEWYYNLWKNGMHKGKMKALVQVNMIKYYRDSNKDKKLEYSGKMHEGIIGINMHTVTYNKKLTNFVRKYISGWSVGCQVINHVDIYYKILEELQNKPYQSHYSYCLIDETDED